jgi:hypothetical protein
METLCACGVYYIEQRTASYRKGEKPMCAAETCAKVRWHNRQGYRRVPEATPLDANLAAG